MKRQKKSAGPIRRLTSNATGSIALEAAIVAPMFLFVMLFLITMIRIAAVQMALHDTAAQAARQTAANIHPVALAAESLADLIPDPPPGMPELPGAAEVAGLLGEWVPDPAGSLLRAVGEGDWRAIRDQALTVVGRPLIEPLLRDYAEGLPLDAGRIGLHALSLPDLSGGEEPYLTVTVEYELPLNFPFTARTLTLREQVRERVWIPDSRAADIAVDAADREQAALQIVSVTQPVMRGSKASVVALTDPGLTVELSVHFKSGDSVSRHVGPATADANGIVTWTWLVSGNTTPGMWELTVEAGDGTAVSSHFVVLAKSQREE
ncbi:pilus assembly protein [Paenibacillus sp. IB182496]|uniref:Pilus assembly protein n=1 Tax=Paenibacillus sabuli TaxID=2772509 RepID=A0A927GR11_9BACL|nr:TadE/TadG family type IV pilus assembly protein [Paenibacillus sabuli]MBD2844322.1 pilus assembly protein [Paenibacillus sabuli]